MAIATQNLLIARLIEIVVALPLMLELHETIFSNGGADLSQEHHKSILKAVQDGEQDAAHDAMKEHLRHVAARSAQADEAD